MKMPRRKCFAAAAWSGFSETAWLKYGARHQHSRPRKLLVARSVKWPTQREPRESNTRASLFPRLPLQPRPGESYQGPQRGRPISSIRSPRGPGFSARIPGLPVQAAAQGGPSMSWQLEWALTDPVLEFGATPGQRRDPGHNYVQLDKSNVCWSGAMSEPGLQQIPRTWAMIFFCSNAAKAAQADETWAEPGDGAADLPNRRFGVGGDGVILARRATGRRKRACGLQMPNGSEAGECAAQRHPLSDRSSPTAMATLRGALAGGNPGRAAIGRILLADGKRAAWIWRALSAATTCPPRCRSAGRLLPRPNSKAGGKPCRFAAVGEWAIPISSSRGSPLNT